MSDVAVVQRVPVVGDRVYVLLSGACFSWVHDDPSHNGEVGIVDRIWAMDGTDPPHLDFTGAEDHRFFVGFYDELGCMRAGSSFMVTELSVIRA